MQTVRLNADTAWIGLFRKDAEKMKISRG